MIEPGKLGEDKQNKQEKSGSTLVKNKSVLFLWRCRVAGPGAISSTIVYGSRYPATWPIDTVGIGISIIAFATCSWLLFVQRRLSLLSRSRARINVITRIMGLILGALGIEFIANGLRNLFPGGIRLRGICTLK
ncbi:hypothetical protein O9929_10175 [Vibrio lentus]|nr:hypothetical protein [Vibrio lentus]